MKLQQAIDRFSPLIEAQLDIYNSDSDVPFEPINVKEEWFPWNLQRIDVDHAVLRLDVRETDDYVELYGVLPEKVNTESVLVAVVDDCIVDVSGEMEISSPGQQYYEVYLKDDVLYGKWKTVVKLNFDVFSANQKELKVDYKKYIINKKEVGSMITINIPKPADKGFISHRPILVV